MHSRPAQPSPFAVAQNNHTQHNANPWCPLRTAILELYLYCINSFRFNVEYCQTRICWPGTMGIDYIVVVWPCSWMVRASKAWPRLFPELLKGWCEAGYILLLVLISALLSCLHSPLSISYQNKRLHNSSEETSAWQILCGLLQFPMLDLCR